MLQADEPTMVLSDSKGVICAFKQEELRIFQSITTVTEPPNEETVSETDSAERFAGIRAISAISARLSQLKLG